MEKKLEQNYIQSNPKGTVFTYKKELGCFWSESLLFRVSLLQMQKAETDDVILVLFFFYKGSFAIVC